MEHPLTHLEFARALEAVEHCKLDGIPVSPKAGLAIACLCWPRIVEYSGCYILESQCQPRNVDEWLRQTQDNKTAVEQTLNHMHLWDVFGGTDSASDSEIFDQLARLLGHTWKASALAQHPQVQFESSVNLSGSEDYGPTVYLWAVR